MTHNTKQIEEIERKRLENIMAQIEAFERGDVLQIHCPYCAGVNSPLRQEFCCKLFAQASLAALERLRVNESTEVCQKIAERHTNN